jgi:hypothetical protein
MAMVQAETQAERALDQVVGWLEHFQPLEDPRQAGKVCTSLFVICEAIFSSSITMQLSISATKSG